VLSSGATGGIESPFEFSGGNPVSVDREIVHCLSVPGHINTGRSVGQAETRPIDFSEVGTR
jgi:hypothetical protein